MRRVAIVVLFLFLVVDPQLHGVQAASRMGEAWDVEMMQGVLNSASQHKPLLMSIVSKITSGLTQHADDMIQQSFNLTEQQQHVIQRVKFSVTENVKQQVFEEFERSTGVNLQSTMSMIPRLVSRFVPANEDNGVMEPGEYKPFQYLTKAIQATPQQAPQMATTLLSSPSSSAGDTFFESDDLKTNIVTQTQFFLFVGLIVVVVPVAFIYKANQYHMTTFWRVILVILAITEICAGVAVGYFRATGLAYNDSSKEPTVGLILNISLVVLWLVICLWFWFNTDKSVVDYQVNHMITKERAEQFQSRQLKGFYFFFAIFVLLLLFQVYLLIQEAVHRDSVTAFDFNRFYWPWFFAVIPAFVKFLGAMVLFGGVQFVVNKEKFDRRLPFGKAKAALARAEQVAAKCKCDKTKQAVTDAVHGIDLSDYEPVVGHEEPFWMDPACLDEVLCNLPREVEGEVVHAVEGKDEEVHLVSRKKHYIGLTLSICGAKPEVDIGEVAVAVPPPEPNLNVIKNILIDCSTVDSTVRNTKWMGRIGAFRTLVALFYWISIMSWQVNSRGNNTRLLSSSGMAAFIVMAVGYLFFSIIPTAFLKLKIEYTDWLGDRSGLVDLLGMGSFILTLMSPLAFVDAGWIPRYWLRNFWWFYIIVYCFVIVAGLLSIFRERSHYDTPFFMFTQSQYLKGYSKFWHKVVEVSKRDPVDKCSAERAEAERAEADRTGVNDPFHDCCVMYYGSFQISPMNNAMEVVMDILARYKKDLGLSTADDRRINNVKIMDGDTVRLQPDFFRNGPELDAEFPCRTLNHIFADLNKGMGDWIITCYNSKYSYRNDETPEDALSISERYFCRSTELAMGQLMGAVIDYDGHVQHIPKSKDMAYMYKSKTEAKDKIREYLGQFFTLKEVQTLDSTDPKRFSQMMNLFGKMASDSVIPYYFDHDCRFKFEFSAFSRAEARPIQSVNIGHQRSPLLMIGDNMDRRSGHRDGIRGHLPTDMVKQVFITRRMAFNKFKDGSKKHGLTQFLISKYFTKTSPEFCFWGQFHLERIRANQGPSGFIYFHDASYFKSLFAIVTAIGMIIHTSGNLEVPECAVPSSNDLSDIHLLLPADMASSSQINHDDTFLVSCFTTHYRSSGAGTATCLYGFFEYDVTCTECTTCSGTTVTPCSATTDTVCA